MTRWTVFEYHTLLKKEGSDIMVCPAFRPDKAMQIEDPALFNQYLLKLEQASGISISNYEQFLDALKNRHDYTS